jgi:A/G-specific adenine glycosylase
MTHKTKECELFFTGGKTFAQILVDWQKRYGRHNLPWQNTHDPYRIWLSEVMLQQTQVSTVIPYYQRFLERFPTVQDLARADLDEVLQYWSGLGYYSRARHLHQCAQMVVSQYRGNFPTEPTALAELPGIGLSTAAAIAVFSAGKKAAILDGNVIRVLSRVFAVTEHAATAEGKKQFWQLAHTFLPDIDIESYTQGLMDLGATLCTRTNPRCLDCPFRGKCQAQRLDLIHSLPVKKVKRVIPLKETIMVAIQSKNLILLSKRPVKGIWGGLYSLPECPVMADSDIVKVATEKALTFGEVKGSRLLPSFNHQFTHFRLKIIPVSVAVSLPFGNLPEGHLWAKREEALALGLPAPVRSLIVELMDDGYSVGSSR